MQVNHHFYDWLGLRGFDGVIPVVCLNFRRKLEVLAYPTARLISSIAISVVRSSALAFSRRSART